MLPVWPLYVLDESGDRWKKTAVAPRCPGAAGATAYDASILTTILPSTCPWETAAWALSTANQHLVPARNGVLGLDDLGYRASAFHYNPRMAPSLSKRSRSESTVLPIPHRAELTISERE